jgi:hypothetical protein
VARIEVFAPECFRRVSPALQVARPDHDRHTSPAELAGDLEADPPIRARDQRNLRAIRTCTHDVLHASLQR